jgi:hypothetical protein
VAGVIRALPDCAWTAIKITQFGHGICSISGQNCDCCLSPEHAYAISLELEAGDSDTGRFMAAGARTAYWVRTAVGQLAVAMPAVRKVLAASAHVIIESNSVLEFLEPDLYLAVLDFSQRDFKASSQRFLARADAVVTIDHGLQEPLWTGVPPHAWNNKPRFAVGPPQYVTAALKAFVKGRLAVTEPPQDPVGHRPSSA